MAKSRYPSKRLFKSDFCEYFSHVHPATPLLIFAPAILFMIWYSSARLGLSSLAILGVGAVAVLFWTITEYTLHRFLFHYPFPGEWGAWVHRMIHGVHHEDPNDPTRLVMPPFLSIVLSIVFFRFFELVMGPVYCVPFMAFFLVGYLAYDYTHYYVHHARPTTSFGKLVKQSHMDHHYVAPDSHWGVSTPLWDMVFGTLHTRKPAAAELAAEPEQQGSTVSS